VTVALLVASCSGGGGKQSTPTAKVTATTTTNPAAGKSYPAPVQPLRVVAKLGPCPSTYPNTPFAKLNAGVTGLDKKLVPIVATEVEICAYGRPLRYPLIPPPFGLFGSGRLTAPAAVTFEDETNRLRPYPSGTATWRGGCIKYPGPLLVMFANGSQRVEVLDTVGCAVPVSNGVLHVRPTTKWLTELQQYTNPYPNGHELRMGDATRVGPTMPTGAISPAPTGVPG